MAIVDKWKELEKDIKEYLKFNKNASPEDIARMLILCGWKK